MFSDKTLIYISTAVMIYVCFRDTVKVYENCNNLYTLGPVIIHNFGPFSSQKSQNTYKYSKKCNNGL